MRLIGTASLDRDSPDPNRGWGNGWWPSGDLRTYPPNMPHQPGGVNPNDRSIGTLWKRSYSVLIFSSLSRLAAMDSRTGLVPLIHAPPSRRRSSGKGPESKTSVTTVASSPSGVRM
jgi:hypothetical protein